VHDSWAFSGAEHYQNIEELDERYKMGYSRNSKPLSTKGYDLCRRVFLLKKRYLQAKNIYFIAPSSKWKELIHTSSLFKDKECQVIPNIINHSVFVKKEKAAALGLIGINGAKKIIGFGAAYSITNKRSIKGGHLLLEALNNILEPESYTLIIFGPADQEFAKNSKVTTQFMGNIQNPHILATIYSLCDVFVCPSLVENLPYTCLEAICCGTPVVAFRTGGIPDIIEHKNNGYLAKPFEIEDLLEGILYCIREHDVLSENALRKSVHDFDTLNIVEQHKEIYSRTLDKRNMSI
jgi:glycosyltransferase involved in cell wall biosynthesis